MSAELSGRRALVTGGTAGIGLASARLLARAGAEVVVTGRDAEQGVAAAAERGIGSCVQFSIALHPDVVRTELELPDELKVLCGLSIGYPIRRFRPTTCAFPGTR